MLRTVKLPHRWDEYKHKLHLTQGGTGEKTAPEALAALNGVPRDTLGMPGGVLPLRADSTIDPKYFGTLVLSEITIDGPSEVNGGEYHQYNITNYDAFTPYFIIPLNGQVTRDGPIIFYKADNIRAQGGFTINGKYYPVQINGAGPETPRLISPLQGEIDKDLSVLLVLTPYRVVGNSNASWRSTHWQVSKDPSFQTLAIDREVGEEHKSNFLAENLEPDTLYYFRAKYNSHNNSETLWSEVVSARTRKVYAVPRIISPVVGRDHISDLLNFETSPFSSATLSVTIPTVIAGVTTGHLEARYNTRHDSTEWEIAENPVFTDSRIGKIEGPNVRGAVDGLEPGKTYYLRVRHNHVGDRPVRSHANGRFDTETRFETGTWSKPVVVKTLMFFGAPAPKIQSPENGSGSLGPTVTVIASNYYSPTDDKHVSTDWEVAKDPGFVNIYRRSEEDKENLTRFVLKSVPTSTTYYVRVRYNSKRHGKGQWSSTVNFTTKAFYGSDTPGGGLTKPSIYRPSEGAEVPAGAFEVVSSPFAPDEAGPHFSSDWQISRHSNFNTVDRQLIGSVAAKTNWTVDHLTPGTTYFVRVRHNSRDYGSSPWSEPHRFRIAGAGVGDGGGSGPIAPDDRTVEISSIIPTKPRLQTPANNSNNVDETVWVQLDEYKPVVVNARVPIVINNYSNTKMEVSYSSIHNGTDWELSTVESFPEDASTTKGSFTDENLRFPVNGLNKNTTYYLRVRFNHDFKTITEVDKDGIFKFVDKHEVGMWSDVIIFHTAKNFGPVAPTITSHTNEQTIDGNEEEFVATPYQSRAGETYRDTEWQYAETKNFQGPTLRTQTVVNAAESRLQINDIVFNRTYYVRVRHNSTSHKGDWSETLTVRSELFTLEAPTILTPTENQSLEGPDATVTGQALSEFVAGVTVRQWEVEDTSDNSAISQDQLTFTKTSPILTIRNVSEKTLRVRVKYELYGVAETPWSEWRTFSVRARVAPNKPSITSPANNTQLNENRVTLTVSDYSHPDSTAFKHAVWEYASSPDFQQDRSEVQREDNTLTVEGMQYRNYYFRVKHVDVNDMESAWSDTVSVILDEPAPDKPSVATPVNDTTVKAAAISLSSSAYSTTGFSSLRMVEYEITQVETKNVETRQAPSVSPVDFSPATAGTYRIRVRHQSEGLKFSEWSDFVEVAYQKPLTSENRNVRVPVPLPGISSIPESGRTDFLNTVVGVPNTPYDDEIKTVMVQLSKQKDFSDEPLAFNSTVNENGLHELSVNITDRSTPYYMRTRYVTEASKQSDWSPVQFYYRPAADNTTIVYPENNSEIRQGPVVLKALTGVENVAELYDVRWEVREYGRSDLIAVASQENGSVSTAVLENVAGKQLNVRVRLKKKNAELYTNFSDTISFRVDDAVDTVPSKPRIITPTMMPGNYHVASSMELTIASSVYAHKGNKEHASTDWQIALDSNFKEIVEFVFKDTDDKLALIYRTPLEDSLYFVRARHRDVDGGLSAWSEPVAFYSATTTPEMPRVTAPENNGTGNSIGFVEATAYENNLSDPLEYEISVKDAVSQTPILTRSGALTRGTTRLVEITDVIDNKVHIRVRYKNAKGYFSKWSLPVTYTSFVSDELRPGKPSITSPELNQYLSSGDFTFTSSAFQAKAEETHSFTDWEIVKDPAQSAVYLKNYRSFVDTTQWVVQGDQLSGQGKLHVRVRYRGSNNIYSPWSDFVAFNAPLVKPVKPSILEPSTGTITTYNVTFRVSEYIYPDSALRHVKWMVTDKDTQTTLLETTTTGLELSTTELNGKNVVVKAQHVAQNGKESEFSDPVEYQIRATPLSPPTINKPVEGGRIYTLDPEMRVEIPESGFTNVYWEVSMFQDFPSFIQQTDTGVIPNLNLQSEAGERYLRVRYRNTEGRMSDWSTVVHFTVVEGENPELTLPTPSVEEPTQNQILQSRSIHFTSSPFNKEGDTLKNAEWEIRDIFTGVAQHNADLTGLAHDYPLVQDSAYRVRVRHHSTKGLTSKWSAWREFVAYQKTDYENHDLDLSTLPFPGRIVENAPLVVKNPFRRRWGNDKIERTSIQFAKDPGFKEILFQDSDKEEYTWQVPALSELGSDNLPVIYSRAMVEFEDGRDAYTVLGTTVIAQATTDTVLTGGAGKGTKLLSPREADVVMTSPVQLVAATKTGAATSVRFEVRSVLDDALVQDSTVNIDNSGDRTATLTLLGQNGKSLKARTRLADSQYSNSEWSDWVHFNVSSEAAMKPIAPQFGFPQSVLTTTTLQKSLSTEAYSHPNNTAHSETHWEIALDRTFRKVYDWKVERGEGKTTLNVELPHYDGFVYVRARFRDANGAFSDWSRVIRIEAPSSRPETPSVIEPVGGQITGRRATFKGSPFNAATGAIQEAQWTITYTAGVDSPPEVITKTGQNETLVVEDLKPDTTIDVKVRYVNTTGAVSDEPTGPRTYTVQASAEDKPGKPSITQPTANQTLESGTVEFRGSTYQTPASNSPHNTSQWRVEDVDNEHAYEDSGVTGSSLTSWSAAFNKRGQRLRAKVRYISSDGVSSDWSDYVEFRIASKPQPPAVTQPENSAVGVSIESNLELNTNGKPVSAIKVIQYSDEAGTSVIGEIEKDV